MDTFLIHIGSSALAYALLAAVFTAVMGVLAVQLRSASVLSAMMRGVWATTGLTVLASVGLWAAFFNDRFDVEYVFDYSSRDLPMAYKFAAFWGGQKGSLMLWALILALFTVVVVRPKKSGEPLLMAGVASVLMTILAFFLVLANFSTDPFEALAGPIPPDGNGLNPLLQHPAMAIHPPMLYLGFVGMSVPFAFMMSALLQGRRDDRWIRMSRKPTLIAWTALFIGNMLGMAWAYMELGWGGYWAWDPVENAACMPLLTGTAFLHSVMIQERRGMLKMWNAVLVAITFILTIFGTFLTRSGVVSSVHSFGASTLGSYFLVFLTVCIVASIATIVWRKGLLRSEHQLDSIWSREAAFIVNNIILVGAAFSILWGTLYPVVSEAVAGTKASVGAPFFNRVNIPIAVVLLLLTGIGPLIAWRKASLEQLRKSFLVPLLVGGVLAALLAMMGFRHTYALLVFGLSMFVLATIVEEFVRGIRARRGKYGESIAQALGMLVLRNPRRYGGYLVHLGVLLFFVGIAASSAYKIESEALLLPGQEMTAGPYTLRLDKVDPVNIPRASGIAVTMTASRDGKPVATLRPERLVYRTGIREDEQPTTNVAIRSNLVDDLYLVPAAYFPDSGKTHLRAFVNPMVSWIWTGGTLVLFGIFVALIPVKRAPTTHGPTSRPEVAESSKVATAATTAEVTS